MEISEIPEDILKNFRKGVVIPAHPLALNENRKLDESYQKVLTRYYIDSGVGGLAVGVHTTQFEIRNPEHNLFKPVLQLASETIDEYCIKNNKPGIMKIAGICGQTEQAFNEAEFAVNTGYHAGLLSLSAYKNASIDTIISHCRTIAEKIPIIGFYLQPSVGGRKLPYEFWLRFAEIENILGIKMAPFNRYQTLDVIRAVCETGREKDITLYTGNDDNILIDLLTEFKIQTSSGEKKIRIKGGLLGHWAVWTKKAVKLLYKVHEITSKNSAISPDLLTLAAEITDSNAALFDAANDFKGCIAGIHEALKRQELMKGIWCLNTSETLSPGQKKEIDRVYKSYPHLNDDAFVKENIHNWIE